MTERIIDKPCPLPSPDEHGAYHYPDGCVIWESEVRGSWRASWADRTHLRGDNDEISFFDSPGDAARALAAGGEGPVSISRTHPVSHGVTEAEGRAPANPRSRSSMVSLLHRLAKAARDEHGAPLIEPGELIDLWEENRVRLLVEHDVPFSIECTECQGSASGEGIDSYEEAVAAGWEDVIAAPGDFSTSHFLGLCPEHAGHPGSASRAARNREPSPEQELAELFRALPHNDRPLALLAMGMLLFERLGGEVAKTVMSDDSDKPLGAVVVMRGERTTRELLEAIGLAEDAWDAPGEASPSPRQEGGAS